MILLVHAAATWAMVGLIWFVQVVHYPLFASVGTDRFLEYEAAHARRTAYLVAVFMPVELIAGARLAIAGGGTLEWVGLGLLVALLLSTGLWQALLHGQLHEGFDAGVHSRLVNGNWLRTTLWSVRGVLVLAMIGVA